ncbi:MAG TPA: T9SS type A sorting domain-containing protein [Cytophagaceae bacterium]
MNRCRWPGYLVLILSGIGSASFAQGIYNNGATIVVTASTTIYVHGGPNGSYLNEYNGGVSNGAIDNDGTIIIEGNWTNNASNNVFYNNDTEGKVHFIGAVVQTISGSSPTKFENLVINNSTVGTAIQLNVDAEATNSIELIDGIVTTGVNTLILSSDKATSLIGYSNSNFVNGTLRRYINNSGANTDRYAFPVGRGTTSSDYFLIELENNNLTGNGFTYVNGRFDNYPAGGMLSVKEEGTVYYAMCTTGVWRLNPDNAPSNGKYNIIAYTENLNCDLTDNQFAILKRPDASSDEADWACTPCGFSTDPADGINPNNGLGRLVAHGYALRRGFTEFSQFAIGMTSFPLPVQLHKFTGEPHTNGNILVWETEKQESIAYFEVERSGDNLNFEIFQTIEGRGNNYFTTLDDQPYRLTYYRLKIVEKSGEYYYSSIIAIHQQRSEMITYSNPVNQYLTFTYAHDPSDYQVMIYNMQGTKLTESPLMRELDVSYLPAGVYLVIIQNPNFETSITGKLVKE